MASVYTETYSDSILTETVLRPHSVLYRVCRRRDPSRPRIEGELEVVEVLWEKTVRLNNTRVSKHNRTNAALEQQARAQRYVELDANAARAQQVQGHGSERGVT